MPDAGKRDIVQRTAQVLVQGNRIAPVEQQVLLELGRGLGFRPDEIRRISTEAPNDSGSLL